MTAAQETLVALRRTGIGGTDASAILGLNPYRTPLQVWAEKRGLVAEREQTDAMYWGAALEPVIARRYMQETGAQLYHPENVFHHAEHDVLLGTPDYMVAGAALKGLEIKTAGAHTAHRWGRPGTDEVPSEYVIQCVHYMAVTGAHEWDLAVLIGGQDFRIYTLHWDGDLWAEIEPQLIAWWQRHMVEGVEPEAVAADNEFMARRFPKNTGDMLPVTDELYALVRERKLATLDENDAQERRAAAEAKLKQAIGERDGIDGEDFRLTWKANRDTIKTDWEAAFTELRRISGEANAAAPQVVADYTSTKPGARVLRYSERGEGK
jgi:putative phage-type endonuclease